jgi:hypothetical protein
MNAAAPPVPRLRISHEEHRAASRLGIIMAENVSHHYVPQFYFKLFAGGGRQICVLLLKEGRIVPHAPIKGQCAHNMFYGTVEIEREFSKLEGLHATTLRALVEAAATGDPTKWSRDLYPLLLQAVAFQRARTMLEVEKVSPAMTAMHLRLFKEYVRATRPAAQADEIIGAIDGGLVEITKSPTVTVFQQLQAALESAALLADLLPCILRNHTDYPFIFSDSPVVFYNTYYRNITDRGVLGYQTPGLQVFLPLTSSLQLMLFDPVAYSGRCRNGPCCDVVERSDVSGLNALQLHHSRQAVYFAKPDDADYVKTLYEAHKPCLVKPETVFRVRNDLRVEGESAGGEIMHSFEPQVKYNLSLSFVDCTPAASRDYVFRHRSPALVAEHDKTRV